MFDWSQLPVIQVPVKPLHNPLRRALFVGAALTLVAFAVVVGCA